MTAKQGAALTLLGNVIWCLDEIQAKRLRATPELLKALQEFVKVAQDLALKNM